MAGINFTLDAAKRIIAAVKRVEHTPQNLAGDRNAPRDVGASFWAALTGCDATATWWDWLAVIPSANVQPPNSWAFTTASMWSIREPYTAGFGNAREANNAKGMDPGTVVLVTFMGYTDVGNTPGLPSTAGTITTAGKQVDTAATKIPLYVFQYAGQQQQSSLPIHDHRDNVTGGGFAFGVYHPGTSLPQQPWSI